MFEWGRRGTQLFTDFPGHLVKDSISKNEAPTREILCPMIWSWPRKRT